MEQVVFRSAISKDEILRLPYARFRGEVIVVNDEKGAKAAAEYLLTQDTIGVDTETKPCFSKGGRNPVALLQLSSLERCFLIRLNKLKRIPQCIKEIFENENIVKVGLSFGDDMQAIHRRDTINLKNLVELQQLAPKYGILDKSLAKMYAIIFGEQISKRQRLTNWEAERLTEKQVQYAALDAYATLSIYLCLKESIERPDIQNMSHTTEEEIERRKREIYERLRTKNKEQSEVKSEEDYIRILKGLYHNLQGKKCDKIDRIKAAGSGRKYYRLSGVSGTFVGTIGESVKENEAFFAVSEAMKKSKVLAPRIVAKSNDELCYLQTDCGDTSLYDAIQNGVSSGRFSKKELSLLVSTIEKLPQIQYKLLENLDFKVCYPEAEFTEAGVMQDLEKFRGCFLKHQKDLTFDRKQLDGDFKLICEDFSKTRGKYWGFMYRDFQTRNVMIKGISPAFIDFQGGRFGPCLYDVASFVYQARARFTSYVKNVLIDAYISKLKEYVDVDRDEVMQQLEFFVFLRMLQVLGTYGLRGYIEGKEMFLESIPQALNTLYPYIRKYGDRYVELCRVLKILVGERYDNSILEVKVMSFSYKRGIPEDESGNGGGYVFDCRAVHNPGKYEEYKQKTGMDSEVQQFLEEDGEMLIFLKSIYELADKHVERYIERGFTNLMFSFGCTGGQHRSVYGAEHLAEHLSKKYGVKVKLEHREQGVSREYDHREI